MTPPLAVKEGWKMAPVEPTEAMLEAGHEEHGKVMGERFNMAERPHHAIHSPARKMERIYKAMLAAAPTFPNTGGPTEEEIKAALQKATEDWLNCTDPSQGDGEDFRTRAILKLLAGKQEVKGA